MSKRRFSRYAAVVGATVLCIVALTPLSARADAGRIDVNEHRTAPVPHQYIHGALGDDSKFQLDLPDNWNGELLIGARGYSGDENSSGAFKTVGLQKGYAYALSDQGWFKDTVGDIPDDKYYESKRRILQLTQYAKSTVQQYYGQAPSRTFMVGGSNGGHNTKWMVEEYPEQYDGGLAGYGITSHLEWLASCATFLRNYDVIADRIDDIVAARTADRDWNPTTQPLSPPLTPAQIQALENIYDMPAVMRDGTTYNSGRRPGSEYRWADNYDNLFGYVQTSLPELDPKYDPNGDGTLSADEIKAWDPDNRPPSVSNDSRRSDLTGDLKRPLIVVHGADDPIVSPGETEVYQRLVEKQVGVTASRDLLAVYYIPGMGHGGAEFDAIIGTALDALEAWVDHRQSGGAEGSSPPDVLGSYPRAN